MKNVIKKWVVDFPGFESLCRFLTRNHVRTIMYHRFSTNYNEDPRFVDSSTLKIQMKYLRDHHAIVEPDSLIEAFDKGDVQPCSVSVTVDDGYDDFFEVAYPVFSEFGIPAMLFVVTGFVGGHTWLWWDKLEFLLQSALDGEYRFPFEGRWVNLDLTSQTSRNRTWHFLADSFRFIDNDKKEDSLIRLEGLLDLKLPSRPPPSCRAVSWDQIREMALNGIRFGAHTVHHPILSRVAPGEAEEEVVASKTELEGKLGTQVNWFAYPQGGPADFNDTTREIVARNFSGCFVAFQDLDNTPDRYSLSRYGVSDDVLHFRWVLCGAEYIGLKIRKLLGLPTGVGESYWTGSEMEEVTDG